MNKLKTNLHPQDVVDTVQNKVKKLMQEANLGINLSTMLVYKHLEKPHGLDCLDELLKASTPFIP